MKERTYLVTHGKSSIISSRSPEVGDVCYIKQVDKIQPAVKDEPSRLPMIWNEVWTVTPSEGKRVQEKEAKDDHDASENAPP